MGEPQDHGKRMMHAPRCRAFEQILGICSLCGSVTHELHSDAIGSRQDSVHGVAWEQATFEASPCFRMIEFCPHSEREMKEAGSQSHSQHICWVQHID
jgi:hypothetical protein